MSTEANLEAMRAMLLPLAEGDSRAFLCGLADDITWRVSGTFPWAGTYRGKQVLRDELFGIIMTRMKQPYRVAVKHLSGAGEFVTVELHGVDNATLDGKPYAQQYCWICRLQDGQLKEVTEFADSYLVMNTFGAPGTALPGTK